MRVSTKGVRIGLLAIACAAGAASAQNREGYDPLRQITRQMTEARLLIVQDTTGSMAWDVNGNNVGQDSTGSLVWAIPKIAGCTGVGPCTHTYTLSSKAPARMALVKNALGDSVSIATDLRLPANTDWQTLWAGQPTNPNYPKTTTIGWPANKGDSGPWTFTVNYPSGSTYTSDKGVPIHVSCGDLGAQPFPGAAACTVSDFPTAPPICATSPGANACTPRPGFPLVPALYTFLPPADVIGTNADFVRWGLVAFSSSRGTQVLVPIDTVNPKDVTKLEQYMQLSGAAWSGSIGLTASGGTNTIAALTQAEATLKTTFAADPKAACNPPYGVILATDGLSNDGNPDPNPRGGGGNWISPCNGGVQPDAYANGCRGATCCDPHSSGYDCPSTPSRFAAQVAHDIWNLNLGGTIHPRTWTIGVSTMVGPCELDYIAYAGRTDASSPNGDTGWDTPKDGYTDATGTFVNLLPTSDAPGPLPSPSAASSTYDGPTGQNRWFRNGGAYNPPPADVPPPYAGFTGHGPYAFFATSAGSIAEAFSAIVNATGTGDYATSSPTAAGSIGSQDKVVLSSADFPAWRGHLYWFDMSKSDPADPEAALRLFDAGELLAAADPANRKIFTWDANRNVVEVTQGTIGPLRTIAGANGLADTSQLTASVVDFIRGYDGSMPLATKKRSWILGPAVNATPAITGPPAHWAQGKVSDHGPFETKYQKRRPLVWVGSDDGMMHAFDFETGREELAILPPDMLAKQVTLYQNFRKKSANVTGQPDRISQHVFGVASALRYADVWVQSDKAFHTIGLLTEAGGGTTIAALDLTHPYGGDTAATPAIPADVDYDSASPFRVLWSVSAATLPNLHESWSIPALAATSADTWDVVFGAGFDETSSAAAQKAPRTFTLNVSGNVNVPTSFNPKLLSAITTPKALVGNQAFADAVVFSTLAPGFRPDNLADLGLQADLNGRIWFLTGKDLADAPFVGINANAVSGLQAQQPLYYPPAASGYGPRPTTGAETNCDNFAFGSGSFYESSATVTGPAIGADPNFVPSVYLATNRKPLAGSAASAVPAANVSRTAIQGKWTVKWVGGADTSATLSAQTQLVTAPLMITPPNGKGPVQALFGVFDPLPGCNGESYVLSFTFTPPSNCSGKVTVSEQVAYDTGARAMSGFVLYQPGDLAVGVSGIGQGQKAKVLKKPANQTAPAVIPRINWWKEHR